MRDAQICRRNGSGKSTAGAVGAVDTICLLGTSINRKRLSIG